LINNNPGSPFSFKFCNISESKTAVITQNVVLQEKFTVTLTDMLTSTQPSVHKAPPVTIIGKITRIQTQQIQTYFHVEGKPFECE